MIRNVMKGEDTKKDVTSRVSYSKWVNIKNF